MTTEADFLEQLAERPFDRALRLVFADWLLENDDPRGEVIALSYRKALSLTEKRKILKLTAAHGLAWLGPLGPHVVSPATRWEQGFPVEIVLSNRVTAQQMEALSGDPRWATVRSLSFPLLRRVATVAPLLTHARMRQLKRIVGEVSVWEQLAGLEVPFTLETVGVFSWGAFEREDLESLAGALKRIPQLVSDAELELSPAEFISAFNADRLLQSLLRADFWERRFATIRLEVTNGVLEGAAGWLNALNDDLLIQRWRSGLKWSVRFNEVLFSVERKTPIAHFSKLTIDLTGPRKSHGLGQRLASAAAILVQLNGRRLTEIELLVEHGATVRPSERDAIRASVRRLGQLDVRIVEAGEEQP